MDRKLLNDLFCNPDQNKIDMLLANGYYEKKIIEYVPSCYPVSFEEYSSVVKRGIANLTDAYLFALVNIEKTIGEIRCLENTLGENMATRKQLDLILFKFSENMNDLIKNNRKLFTENIIKCFSHCENKILLRIKYKAHDDERYNTFFEIFNILHTTVTDDNDWNIRYKDTGEQDGVLQIKCGNFVFGTTKLHSENIDITYGSKKYTLDNVGLTMLFIYYLNSLQSIKNCVEREHRRLVRFCDIFNKIIDKYNLDFVDDS